MRVLENSQPYNEKKAQKLCLEFVAPLGGFNRGNCDVSHHAGAAEETVEILD